MSTRQAPDSSKSLSTSMNSKKRSSSEVDPDVENSRSPKKSKKDDGTRGKGNRRRKKKRKQSVVSSTEPDARPRSKSRSATVGTQSNAPEDPDIMLANVPDEDTEPLQNMNGIDDADDAEDTSSRIPYADKGKGKERLESLPPVVESPEAQIARLQRQNEAQSLLLQQHQSQLAHVHQALTCQICLDLLYKPFALAPCGHVVCYPCLVRWFTAPDPTGGPHGLEEEIPGTSGTSHHHKKKKCPICRTHVTERPVEVWGIKSMVTSIARSGLVDLPAPAPAPEPEASASTSNDPWHDIFHRASRRSFFDIFEPRPPRPPRVGGEGLEEMGMYDADDGGIYRCIDCMHEIWRGVCTHCHKEYPAHQAREEDDDDDDQLDFADPGWGLRNLLNIFGNGANHRFLENGDDDGSDSVDSAEFMLDHHELEDGEEDDNDDDDVRDRRMGRWNRRHERPRGPVRSIFDGLLDHHEDEEGFAHIDEEVSGDESDEEGYQSSFIDDSEPAQLPNGRSNRQSTRRGRNILVISDDEGQDASNEIIGMNEETAGRMTRLRRRSSNLDDVNVPIVVSDGDDEGPSSSPQTRAVGGRSRVFARFSDSEPVRSTSRRGPRLRQADVIVVSDDDEELPSSSRPRTGFLGTFSEFTDSENEPLTEEEEEEGDDDDDQRAYEDDGSRSGPSSRLLRLMQGPNADLDDDNDGID